jgi:single-strand DNA-binding protein
MYETQVTVVGNLVTDVDRHRLNDGTALAKFRIGSTERRFDKASGTWVDGDRLYVDVRCRRELAENSGASLVKGDPVVVTGKIYTRSFEHRGQRRSSTTLEAHSVAADLSRCTVVLTRSRRGAAVAERMIADAPAGELATVTALPANGRPENENGWRSSSDVHSETAGPEPTGDASDGSHLQLVGAAPGDES